ncbi:MAG TPA: hypothetical protein PKI46_01340 [Bacteroidales bacterium]|nr:hypothetical protein [Bacteroidales bacterium]
MRKTPIWVNDAIIVILLAYLIFSFVIGTMDCTSWTYSERGLMAFIIVIVTILIQFARAGNGEYD